MKLRRISIRIARYAASLLFLATAGLGAQSVCPQIANAIVTMGRIPAISTDPAIVREIDDPSLRNRWLLSQDARHPAGPGVLMLDEERNAPRSGTSRLAHPENAEAPVIHAGERIVVEEETAYVEAHLEGIALNPALPGGPLRVRLNVGGNIVPATAITTGRATLAPEAGGRP